MILKGDEYLWTGEEAKHVAYKEVSFEQDEETNSFQFEVEQAEKETKHKVKIKSLKLKHEPMEHQFKKEPEKIVLNSIAAEEDHSYNEAKEDQMVAGKS